MNLLIVYFLFFIVDYLLSTFFEPFKYHIIGLPSEFLPLIILTIITCFYSKKKLLKDHFFKIYFKYFAFSVLGFLTAKVVLFVQWYWFLHPEYRNMPGDFSEGLSWSILFSVLGTFVILISYLVLIFGIRFNSKNK